MKGSNLPIVAAAYERSCQKKTYRRRFRTSMITKKNKKTNTYKEIMKDKDF
jgi:hypothetical protein